jgi:hypothetical protein
MNFYRPIDSLLKDMHHLCTCKKLKKDNYVVINGQLYPQITVRKQQHNNGTNTSYKPYLYGGAIGFLLGYMAAKK